MAENRNVRGSCTITRFDGRPQEKPDAQVKRMKSRRQDFLLGLVVIAFIVLFLGTFLFVYPRGAGATREITVRFKHDEGVAPLKVGSPVTLGAHAIQPSGAVDTQNLWIYLSTTDADQNGVYRCYDQGGLPVCKKAKMMEK